MIGGIGVQEMLLILLVVLLLFGAKRIPDIAQSLGKGYREFRSTIQQTQDEFKKTVDEITDAVPKSADPPTRQKRDRNRDA